MAVFSLSGLLTPLTTRLRKLKPPRVQIRDDKRMRAARPRSRKRNQPDRTRAADDGAATEREPCGFDSV